MMRLAHPLKLLFILTLLASKAMAANTQALLTIEGRLQSRCTATFDNETNKVIGNIGLNQPGSLSIPLRIDCNVPIQGNFEATNGAFINETVHIDKKSTLLNEVPYTFEADLGFITIGPLESKQLKGGETFGSNDTSVENQNGFIKLSWKTNFNLHAGRFSETIRLHVTPLNP